MKRIIIFLIIFITIPPIFAQTPNLVKSWSYNSAFLMRKGKYECGIFQPFRYGISNRVEIFGNILQMPLVPNVAVKIKLADPKGFYMASQFGFEYNTIMFNLFSKKGIGGILSPQFTYSNMFTLSGAFLVTKQVFDTAYVTARAGVVIGMRDGYLSPLSTIDLPIFYPRLSHLFNKCTFKIGADIKGKIVRKWIYMADFQLYIIPIKENNFFMEHTGTIMCALGKNARLKGGYKICFGEYPFGNQWNLLPVIDIVFGSK